MKTMNVTVKDVMTTQVVAVRRGATLYPIVAGPVLLQETL
jgi:hypothetical protein